MHELPEQKLHVASNALCCKPYTEHTLQVCNHEVPAISASVIKLCARGLRQLMKTMHCKLQRVLFASSVSGVLGLASEQLFNNIATAGNT